MDCKLLKANQNRKVVLLLAGSLFLVTLTSCNSNEPILEEVTQKSEVIPSSEIGDSIVHKNPAPIRKGLEKLIDIQLVNPSIKIDLKYASDDNFMGKRLYFDIDKVYLQKDVAERLSNCQKYLKNIDSSLSLLVYDGVRPLSVQQAMWDALDSIPPRQREKFVSNPKYGSIHNYGAAVDVTICNSNGIPLDMGANYDDIREIAYPMYENKFLKSGELTKQQVENRKLLRKVMVSQQFRVLQTEWWHFNAFTRDEAKKKYEVLN
jgi:zinc D-Ala-D-Ala dipeptidase